MEIERKYDRLHQEEKWFIIEKKGGSIIGWMSHSLNQGSMAVEYAMIPSERNIGYCTEAVMMMVDYLFLSKDIMYIQAETLAENSASQRVLEKAGLKREVIERRSSYVRGFWQDDVLYSILRDEWKEPRLLTRVSFKH